MWGGGTLFLDVMSSLVVYVQCHKSQLKSQLNFFEENSRMKPPSFPLLG